MKLLTDKELIWLIYRNKILSRSEFPRPYDSIESNSEEWYTKDSPIQPTSIDLRVESVFVPGNTEINWFKRLFNQKGEVEKKAQPAQPVNDDEQPAQPVNDNEQQARAPIQKQDNELTQLALKSKTIGSGETVVIETKEWLSLPSNISAIVFPPNKIASKGILVTNPGHIDPGYEGTINFTIINMGKESFNIRAGDIIGTALFFQLDKNVEKNYNERDKKEKDKYEKSGSENSNYQLIKILSKDFLSIESRMQLLFDKQLNRFSLRNAAIAIIIPALVAFAATYLNNLNNSKFSERLSLMEERLKTSDTLNKIKKSNLNLVMENKLLKRKVDSLTKK